MSLSRRSAMAGAAASAVALLGGGCGEDSEREPRNAPASGDLDIVNFALTLEYLEEAYYSQVVEARVLRGREAGLAETIRDNERQHVLGLRIAAEDLGGPVARRPRVDFGAVLSGGRDAVIEAAADLEGTGAGAYLAEADRISDPKILAAALSIHTVEARHAAVLNLLAGRPALPDGAFATPIERPQVMRRIGRFLA